MGIATLTEKITSTGGEKTSGVYLTELKHGTDEPMDTLRFQWFPETLTDTKAINYQQKEVPGASLPLYQWINSGERLISFTAFFTCDNDISGEVGGAKDKTLFTRLTREGSARHNIDIRTAIVWLRAFLHPRYAAQDSDVGVPITFSPRKALLQIPNSGIGAAGFSLDPHSVLVLMNQCDITYEEMFANGLPRIASVQLTFVQIAQRAGGIAFPAVTPETDKIVKGKNNQFFEYTLRALK